MKFSLTLFFLLAIATGSGYSAPVTPTFTFTDQAEEISPYEATRYKTCNVDAYNR